MSEKRRGISKIQQLEKDIQTAKTPEAMIKLKNKAEKKGLGAIFNDRVEKDFSGAVTKINEKNIKASKEAEKLGGKTKPVEEITAGTVAEIKNLEADTKEKINEAIKTNEGGPAKFESEYVMPILSAEAKAFDDKHMEEAMQATGTESPVATIETSSPNVSVDVVEESEQPTLITNPGNIAGTSPSASTEDNSEPENPTDTEEELEEVEEDLEEIRDEPAILTQARKEYFAAHKAFMDARGTGTWNSLKNKVKESGAWSTLKDKLSGVIKFEDVVDKNISLDLEAKQRAYNVVLFSIGNKMVLQKEAELRAMEPTDDEKRDEEELVNSIRKQREDAEQEIRADIQKRRADIENVIRSSGKSFSEINDALNKADQDLEVEMNMAIQKSSEELNRPLLDLYDQREEGIAQALEEYKIGEVFQKLVIDEKQYLIDKDKEQLPSKARATLGKAMKWYGGLNKVQKVALGVAVGTTIAATLAATSAIWASGSIGAGGTAALATLTKAATGKAIMTKLGTIAVGQTLGSSVGQTLASAKNWAGSKLGVFDGGVRNARSEYYNAESNVAKQPFTMEALQKLQKSYDTKLQKEASNRAWKTRTDVLVQLGGGIGLGMLSSNLIGNAIEDYSHHQILQHEAHENALKINSSADQTVGENQTATTEPNLDNTQTTVEHPTTAVNNDKIVTTEQSTPAEVNQTAEHQTEATSSKISEDALVRKGEGISHVLKRQLENNPELAKAAGYVGDASEKHEALVKLLEDKGYTNTNIVHENSVYELKLDSEGNTIVTESHGSHGAGTHTVGESTNAKHNFSYEELKARFGEKAVTSTLKFGEEAPIEHLHKGTEFIPGKSTLIIPQHEGPGVIDQNLDDSPADDVTPAGEDSNTSDDVYAPGPGDHDEKYTTADHRGAPEGDGKHHSVRWWKKHGGDGGAGGIAYNEDDVYYDPAKDPGAGGHNTTAEAHHNQNEVKVQHTYPPVPEADISNIKSSLVADQFKDPKFLEHHVNDPAYPLYKSINEFIHRGHVQIKGETVAEIIERMKNDASDPYFSQLASNNPDKYLWMKENKFIS